MVQRLAAGGDGKFCVGCYSSEHGPDDLADVIGLGHSIIMYGGEAVLEEVAALADGPVDACLVGVFGCAGLLHEADEFLRNELLRFLCL